MRLKDVPQATDYVYLDKVSFFFGVFAYKLCGFYEIALITPVSAIYVNLVNFIFTRLLSPRWTKTELRAPENQIGEFRNVDVQCFEIYQASGISKQKWHPFNHVLDAIKEVRGASHILTGNYQSTN